MKKIIYLLSLITLVIIGILVFRPVESKESKEDLIYMVSHSEYWSGERGQIVTRLLNYLGQPIAADCYSYIWYPNKTLFKENMSMMFTPNANTYTYEFITPDVEGVYEYQALCFYNGINRSAMNSFHISPALNFQKVLNQSLSLGFESIGINLSGIKSDVDYIRNNINANNTEIINQLNSLTNYCGDNLTNSSNLCLWTQETMNRVNSINNTMTISFTSLQNNLTFIYNTTITNFNEINNTINQFRNETIERIIEMKSEVRNIEQTTNRTEQKVDLILQQLNISTDELNIYAFGNNCIVGMNFILLAQVKNQFNIIQDNGDVYCNANTNWDANVSMNYQLIDMNFKYSHVCDFNGTIFWSIECNKLG